MTTEAMLNVVSKGCLPSMSAMMKPMLLNASSTACPVPTKAWLIGGVDDDQGRNKANDINDKAGGAHIVLPPTIGRSSFERFSG